MEFSLNRTVLKKKGLHVTSQRIKIMDHIFAGEKTRHFTAETLFRELNEAGIEVSLATVYNTLGKLVGAKLLNCISFSDSANYYDTNLEQHYHVVNIDTGELRDVEITDFNFEELLEDSEKMIDYDLVIRVRQR